MQLAYDRDSRTLFIVETGHSVADMRDDLPMDQVHALGRALVYAFNAMQRDLGPLLAVLRAAEPPR